MPDSLPTGVHRLIVPLPFVMPALNAWLVDSGNGWVLIDTGMHTTAGWNALEKAFLATGLHWTDLSLVVVTHMHPDHVGLLPLVQKISGAPLAMHVREIDLLNEFAEPGKPEYWNGFALDLAGSPPDLVNPVNAAFRMLAADFTAVNPEHRLEGGERFGSLEVLWSPGHSPGHIVLYDASRKALFSGDHIIDTTSPNIGWLPDGDPLADYLASLHSLKQLDLDLVLPGHGEPIQNHRAWIDRTTAHHESRLRLILDLLRAQPSSAHQLSTALWNRKLSPIDYRFAIFELLAHLIHLEAAGEVVHEGRTWSVHPAV